MSNSSRRTHLTRFDVGGEHETVIVHYTDAPERFTLSTIDAERSVTVWLTRSQLQAIGRFVAELPPIE